MANSFPHLLLLSSQLLLTTTVLLSPQRVHSLPLSTNGRWIIDSRTGSRVKLRCVNWAAHMPAVLAEGLDRQPLSVVSTLIADLGFNCVRLTWATQMFTNPTYANLTVAGSMAAQRLTEAAAGVARNNPKLMEMTVGRAYEEVVSALGLAGLMVVLDNHVSKPQWCCARDDGNGFFGDVYFDSNEWVRGLDAVARRFRWVPQVVGMSMRNELRGPRQTRRSWYRHVRRGARAIHAANPDVLIIVSGLNFDTDLSFLQSRPLAIHFRNLVYEAHWYAFSQGRRVDWTSPTMSSTRTCSGATGHFDRRAGFVAPLFISEFGVDQRGVNRADNRFLSCFLAFAAERDVDWAMWALQGSYYRRNGRDGFLETYGVLDSSWSGPKNSEFRQKFRLIQDMLQDPRSTLPSHHIIYHPLTGKCLQANRDGNNVLLSDCLYRSQWRYGRSVVRLADTHLCLKPEGDGSPVTLKADCGAKSSRRWLSTQGVAGFQLVAGSSGVAKNLCLHWDSTLNSSVVVTKECLCFEEAVCSENPQPQWFKLVPSNA